MVLDLVLLVLVPEKYYLTVLLQYRYSRVVYTTGTVHCSIRTVPVPGTVLVVLIVLLGSCMHVASAPLHVHV